MMKKIILFLLVQLIVTSCTSTKSIKCYRFYKEPNRSRLFVTNTNSHRCFVASKYHKWIWLIPVKKT